jgi:triosephosphate isomerase
VATQANPARRAGLLAISRICKTQLQRRNGSALSRYRNKIAGSIAIGITPSAFVTHREPLWAIGTGPIPAAPEITAKHAPIRECL